MVSSPLSNPARISPPPEPASWRSDLEAAFCADEDCIVRRDVPLATLGRWQIGGPADLVIEPRTEVALSRVLARLSAGTVPVLVIGDGSNLLFDDAGFRGIVVRIGRALSDMRIEGTHVWAQAGIWTPVFARRVGCAGLSGAEHTIGIPGTLGGLVVMNGGSQRKGIGETLVQAICLDAAGRRHVLDHAACNFSYRHSSLQSGNLIVVAAEFRFRPADAAAVRHEMIGIMADRRRKFPLRLPNCGSVFLSDPAMYDIVGPPGKAIEQVGLRGQRIGGAQIAPGHGNFIVNVGRASSNDILRLVALARRTVHARTGFWIDCEVRHVLPNGEIVPAHVSADQLP